jgi:hypothetical protein
MTTDFERGYGKGYEAGFKAGMNMSQFSAPSVTKTLVQSPIKDIPPFPIPFSNRDLPFPKQEFQ